MRPWYLLLLILLLAACNSQALPTLTPFIPTHTPQGPVVPTRTTPTPAPTEVPSATPPATATKQPSPTPANTVTPTATNTPEPTLTPTTTATFTATATPSETVITYGQEETGAIDNTSPVYRYQFTASEGDLVTINLKAVSGNLDPILRLLDATGRPVAQNDDARNNTRDAALVDITLPNSGVYTIIASRFGMEDGTSEGEFTLTIEQPTATSDDNSLTITYGQDVKGRISNVNYERRYVFEATEGDVITIGLLVTNNSFDAFLVLLNADGDELIINDDRSPRVRDSQIADFTIPATGTYTIVATRFSGQAGRGTGTYTLRLSNE